MRSLDGQMDNGLAHLYEASPRNSLSIHKVWLRLPGECQIEIYSSHGPQATKEIRVGSFACRSSRHSFVSIPQCEIRWKRRLQAVTKFLLDPVQPWIRENCQPGGCAIGLAALP